ncbi:hypothetical protein AVA85_16040, partial [Salmonella enterica subsp. enterica serovar Infantis]|nr:hypothetical protein [Salmonella enterica subsp. enterica serovar Infantis]
MINQRLVYTQTALLVINTIWGISSHAAETPVSCYVDNINRTFRCAEGAIASEKNSLSIGLNATTTGERAIAIGAPDNAMSAPVDSSAPKKTTASADGIAIGAGATVMDDAPGGVAIGSRRHEPSNTVHRGDTLYDSSNAGAIVNAINGIAIGSGAKAGAAGNSDSRTIAIGDLANVYGSLNTGVGPGLVIGNGARNSVAIGYSSAVGRQKTGSRVFENTVSATAVGSYAEVMKKSDWSTALGYKSMVLQDTVQSTALGSYAKVNSGSNNSTAIGSFASVAANAENAIALGGGSDSNNAAKANAAAAIAIGNKTNALSSNSVAIGAGSNTTLSATNAIAIGNNTKASAENTISIGSENSLTTGSVAIGANARAGRGDILNLKDAGQPERIWIGKQNNIALGVGAVADGGRVISIGENAGSGTSDNWNIHNVNIGTNAGSQAKRNYSIALGYEAGMVQAGSQDGIEDGKRSPSINIGSQAGKNTVSYGNISVGDNAGTDITDKRSVNNTIIGNKAGVGLTSDDGKNSTFPGFGPGGNTLIGAASGRQLSGDSNVAIGSIAGDRAIGDNNIYVGHLAGQQSNSDRSIIIGSQAGLGTNNDRGVLIGNFANGGITTATRNVVGLGSSVKATGFESIAVGFNANSSANNATSIGRLANASGISAIALSTNAQASGENSVAIGNSAKAMATNTISIGTGNTVSGSNSGALGDPSTVSGVNSYSIGNNNIISASNSFVLGNAVNNAVDNSVVLGNNSAVSAAIATPGYSVNGVSHKFAGSSPVSTVSIGDSGKERTLTNVAAGRLSPVSTDAINGSQLFAVTSEVEKGNLFAGNTGTFNRRLGET